MPTDIEFDYHELDDLGQRVREAGDTVTRISINEGFRKLGRIIVPATGTGPLANATPKITGKLARSTVFQIIGGPMNQVLEVRQAAQSALGVFYGFIVREGRGGVRAINAKALHFFIGGQEFFRKSVGPAEANPYHKRVLAQLKPQIQKVVNDMGRRIIAHISGEGPLQ
ncbi:unnamed protein product [marine sediment metagenome]|uniref:HK97 gp10 family phage protein n=1 Tax=marine sediment metagenome TaxID=412755 RepID=X0WJ25_9ZZZZ